MLRNITTVEFHIDEIHSRVIFYFNFILFRIHFKEIS